MWWRSTVLIVTLLVLGSGCDGVPVTGKIDGDHRVTVEVSPDSKLPSWMRLLLCYGNNEQAASNCVDADGFGLFSPAQCAQFVAHLREDQCDEYRCEAGKMERCSCPGDNSPDDASGWQQCDEFGYWGVCDCPNKDEE